MPDDGYHVVIAATPGSRAKQQPSPPDLPEIRVLSGSFSLISQTGQEASIPGCTRCGSVSKSAIHVGGSKPGRRCTSTPWPASGLVPPVTHSGGAYRTSCPAGEAVIKRPGHRHPVPWQRHIECNGMGVIFDEPKYPVLDKAPGFWRTVGNFSFDDYTTWSVATVASYPFGYIAGKNAGVPRQSAAIAASIGALAGFMLAYQGSSGRLMGFLPNDREVNATLRK